jgi:hypothetical protein
MPEASVVPTHGAYEGDAVDHDRSVEGKSKPSRAAMSGSVR